MKKERLDHTDECVDQHQPGQLDCICGAFQEQRVAKLDAEAKSELEGKEK